MLGKFFIRMGIGAGVLTVCTKGMAPLYLVALIVCSQGKGFPLAILLAIPACYFVGLLCSIWFIPFGPGPRSYKENRALAVTKRAEENQRRDESMQTAIENYISKAMEKGMNKTEIFSQLIRNGWADSDIDAAYKAVQIRGDNIY